MGSWARRMGRRRLSKLSSKAKLRQRWGIWRTKILLTQTCKQFTIQTYVHCAAVDEEKAIMSEIEKHRDDGERLANKAKGYRNRHRSSVCPCCSIPKCQERLTASRPRSLGPSERRHLKGRGQIRHVSRASNYSSHPLIYESRLLP